MSVEGNTKRTVSKILRRQLQGLGKEVVSSTQTDGYVILQTLRHQRAQFRLGSLEGRQRTLLRAIGVIVAVRRHPDDGLRRAGANRPAKREQDESEEPSSA